MAHRELKDLAGMTWQVWEVRPTAEMLPPEVRDGWLAFQSVHERRRLVPIPVGWNELMDAELLSHLERAAKGPAPRRLIE
jgi:hypothetical protein